MRQFMFRALITFHSWTPGSRGPAAGYDLDPGGTHTLMIHAWQAGQPFPGKYFPATITRDDGQPLRSGEHQVVTLTVTDDEAPVFLTPGKPFTIWGGGSGHGIISRRVFTNSGPS